MSDPNENARTTTEERPTLAAENQRLLQEIERLDRLSQDVARANVHAAELMTLLEESNRSLAMEVEKRARAEEGLWRLNAEIDATVQRQTAELTAANGQLTKTNQELKDFAHVVSHDLKAPLRGIKTLAQWISMDYSDKLGQEGGDQMALLGTRVDRMVSLIDGILQYSRVGRDGECKVSVDLNDLVPGIVDLLAAPEHIHITVQSSLPTVQAERTRLSQVLQNLISNAIKYMDKPEGRIHVGCAEDGGLWRFSVEDNGPGIDERYFDRIFKLFETLESRDTCDSTGVGLAVVKKIVETAGGKVWVESKVGLGSTFFFTWPK
jgi:two-component system sensor kinase FixL